MEVSNQKPSEPGGLELLETLVALTGLPAGVVEGELAEVLSKGGRSLEQLTLDDVRAALASHLETLMVEGLVESADPLSSEADLAPARVTPVYRLSDR